LLVIFADAIGSRSTLRIPPEEKEERTKEEELSWNGWCEEP
jgi:hypothetical protein